LNGLASAGSPQPQGKQIAFAKRFQSVLAQAGINGKQEISADRVLGRIENRSREENASDQNQRPSSDTARTGKI
jgi:hypothetical protein